MLCAGKIFGKVLALTVMIVLLVSNTGMAQVILTNGTPTATINFSNTMQTTVGTNPSTAFTAAGFEPAPSTAGRLNSNAWATTGWSDSPDLAFGGTKTAGGTDYTRGTTAVSVTQGGIYSFTGAPGSVADPALMMQPGGSDFTPGTLTLRIQNNGTSLINQLAVSYNIFLRNDNARSNSFNFSYSSDNITYTPVTALDYATPAAADGLGWVAVAGAPSRSTTITGINILPTAYFYIRWTSDDVSGSGSRDELGLDDINITGSFVSACIAPLNQASLNGVNNLLSTQMDIDFQRGDGTGGLMIVVTQGGAALSTNPVNGITYHANSNFGTGDAIGNGFVVYNSNAVVAGTPGAIGTFTMTGLTPSTQYDFYFFEYNISVPCYDGAPNVDNVTTLAAPPTVPVTNATDLFRSFVNGNWADARTWQHSNNGGANWYPSELSPTSASAGISILAAHTVDISCPVSMDQVGISGTLTLSNDGVINLNNGAGFDIDILAGGVLKTQSPKNYSTTFAYTGGPQINVSTAGKITVGNGGSAPGYSALGYTSTLVVWNNTSIFEWNSTDPFITAGGITYFPDAAASTIPIFRVSRTPSLQPGSNSNTTWKGLLEVNANLTLKLGGIKTFRNGIIGTANLFQDDDCAQFVIDGATAQLGGTGAINLNAGGLAINSPSLTTMITDKVVNATAGAGTLTVNGTLYCNDKIMSGTGIFTLATAGTLGIGSSGGISSVGLSGNIQVSGARSFSSDATYIYNGIVNQITSTGLPANINASLIISNTGPSLNNTVTQTNNNTNVKNLYLNNGLFEAGVAQQLNIVNTGFVYGNGGNQSQSAAAGIISFTAAGTVSPGTSLSLTNVDLNGGVNMGGANTSIKGTLNIKTNGFVTTGTAPSYSSSPASTLLYSCGCNYNAAEEWYENTFGASAGVPHHVTLAAGTSLNFTTAGFPREMRGDLTINTGSTFALSTITGGDLYIKGNWIRSGTGAFTPNNRAVKFNGSGNVSITANNGEIFDYLILEKDVAGNTLSLNDNISIRKEYKITTGTFDLLNKNATLVSNATATASFAQVGASGSISYSGTGRFVVERFIPTGTGGSNHGKTWQFLAVPTKGQSVKAAWQENNVPLGNTVPNYGTIITSEKTGAVARGYDIVTAPGPSMKTYDNATNGWISVDDGSTTTVALTIDNQKGYMLFVRGDRSVQTSGGTATATTLRTTGKLYAPGAEAPATTNVVANKFESIGNPYASAVDFTLLSKSGSIDNVFYVWDPTLTGTYGLGGYQTLSSSGGWFPSSNTTNYPIGTSVKTIQSGQAFFVHATGSAGTVGFAETNKVSGSSVVFRPGGNSGRSYLRTGLYTQAGMAADGNIVAFDAGFNNHYDRDDALKILNGGENLGILCMGKLLAVEARRPLSNNDTIFYSFSNLRNQTYKFRFAPENLYIPGMKGYLVDKYLGTKTAVSLSDTTLVSFTVSTDPASADPARFMLVFKRSGPVRPVIFAGIHAIKQGEQVMVDWEITDEPAIDHYDIERSADGIHFTKLDEQAATANGAASIQYSWLDASPLKGNNFYRIRSVSIGNEISYSKQVKVFLGEDGCDAFTIYPNPVKGRLIGLQIDSAPAGSYILKLFSNMGQLIFSTSLYHTGIKVLKQIQVGPGLVKGIYRLEIAGPNAFRQTKKLLVD